MKKMIVAFALVVGMLAPAAALVALPAPAYADAFSSSNAKSQACSGISGAEAAGQCTTTGKSVDDIIKSIVNFMSALIGVVAVVMVMVGGFKYVTSGGDASKAGAAKSTLTYAIIGLVIVAMAQFIVQFVFKEVTKPGNGNPTKKAALIIDYKLNP
ncbi:MAG: hypothetical protein ABWY71_00430 [Candidatus Saccharimonadales bacterium]